MSQQFYTVAAQQDLPDGTQMHVDLNGTELLLINFGGEYFAVDYYCSHEKLGMEGGLIENYCLHCPHHSATFDIRDGSVQSAPAWEDILTYSVKVEDGLIQVSVE